MSLKTCKYCNQKYPDNWNNWISKFCCSDCYRKRKSLYHNGDNVYTFDNIKLKDKSGFEVILATGTIKRTFEMWRPTLNGIWKYQIILADKNKSVERFEHQIFTDLSKAIEYIKIINETRRIKREVNKLVNNLKEDLKNEEN